MITGGSSGIGLATAKRFAAEGYHVAICGRSLKKLEAAKTQIDACFTSDASCHAISVDLSDVASTKRVGEEMLSIFGRVDVLINNASMAPMSDFEAIEPDVFESTTNVNIRSVFYLTQIAWRAMKAQGSGTVVNISSMAAVDPFPGFNLYGASKAWIELLTSALAVEGKEDGLRVCAVRPGAVETPMLRGLFPDFPADQCVQPEEIANQVWRCVADIDNHANGAVFEVTNQPSN